MECQNTNDNQFNKYTSIADLIKNSKPFVCNNDSQNDDMYKHLIENYFDFNPSGKLVVNYSN